MTRYLLIAALSALCAAVAFGAWQYVRAERLADAKQRLDTCEEVRGITDDVLNKSDDDLTRALSGDVPAR